jgi:hypothetical protein
MTQIIYKDDAIIATHSDTQVIDMDIMYPNATGVKHVAGSVKTINEIEVEIVPDVYNKKVSFKKISELVESSDQKWESIRFERNKLLKESDLQVMPDVYEDMTEEEKLNIKVYRQNLKDITEDYNRPEDVIWPTLSK